MKHTIITIGIILLILNLIVGLILSVYGWQNVLCSSSTIAVTTILSQLAVSSPMKDGFKAGLLLTFTVIGLIQFLLAVFMPSEFTDNCCLVAIFILLVIEIVTLIVTRKTSTAIK